MTSNIEKTLRLYKIIANHELDDSEINTRAQIVHQLESDTRQSFLNTKDFHAKMELYLSKGNPK